MCSLEDSLFKFMVEILFCGSVVGQARQVNEVLYFIKNKTQTAVINIINLRIFI